MIRNALLNLFFGASHYSKSVYLFRCSRAPGPCRGPFSFRSIGSDPRRHEERSFDLTDEGLTSMSCPSTSNKFSFHRNRPLWSSLRGRIRRKSWHGDRHRPGHHVLVRRRLRQWQGRDHCERSGEPHHAIIRRVHR